MAWTFDIEGPNGGATLGSALPFASAKLTWAVDGPGSVEVDLRVADLDALWQPGTHRVIAKDSGTARWAGYLTRLEQSGPPGAYSYRASGVGLASIFDWRLVRHVYEITDTVDAIVESLLDEMQAQYNGDAGFTMGTATGSFGTRTRAYCFGVVIGEALRELAQTGTGFDWEVDATGALNLWKPSRGTSTGLTLADSDTQSWAVVAETSDLLTTVTAIGDENEVWGPKHRMVRSGLATTYGRREIGLGVTSTDPDELVDAATAELTARGGATLTVKTGWWEAKAPWTFGTVWLNDEVTMTLPSIFGGSQAMRCVDISASLEPGVGLEYVEHTWQALVSDITAGDPDGGE